MAINTYSMVITGRLAGQFVQNVLHFFMDDAGYGNPVGAAKGLTDGWVAAGYHDEFLALCPANYEMLSLKTRRRTGGIGPEWINLDVSGSPGTRTGNSQSSSNGPVILWLPISPNRVTGKTFVPGISSADADQGEILASPIADFTDAATNMIQPFPAVNGGTPEVVQCIVKSTDPAVRYLIAFPMVCKEIGVQRRRQLPV